MLKYLVILVILPMMLSGCGTTLLKESKAQCPRIPQELLRYPPAPVTLP